MIKTTNLRLNLDKPDHRKAYDILKSSDMSYSNTIVNALISFSENEENRKTLLDGIRKIVREEIGTFFQNADSEQIFVSAEITNSEKIQIHYQVRNKARCKECIFIIIHFPVDYSVKLIQKAVKFLNVLDVAVFREVFTKFCHFGSAEIVVFISRKLHKGAYNTA